MGGEPGEGTPTVGVEHAQLARIVPAARDAHVAPGGRRSRRRLKAGVEALLVTASLAAIAGATVAASRMDEDGGRAVGTANIEEVVRAKVPPGTPVGVLADVRGLPANYPSVPVRTVADAVGHLRWVLIPDPPPTGPSEGFSQWLWESARVAGRSGAAVLFDLRAVTEVDRPRPESS